MRAFAPFVLVAFAVGALPAAAQAPCGLLRGFGSGGDGAVTLPAEVSNISTQNRASGRSCGQGRYGEPMSTAARVLVSHTLRSTAQPVL